MTFDRDRFVEDWVDALDETDARAAIMEHLTRAVSDHAAVLKGMGEPAEAGLDVLLRSPRLTIFAAKWAPNMTLSPHNHLMWAMIGIYTGREDNMFWRRLPDGSNRIEAAGAKSLGVGDAEPLGRNIIHSVTNPIPRLTGAIHVYGGDFFAAERSEWDPETLTEGRFDAERLAQRFEAANSATKQGL